MFDPLILKLYPLVESDSCLSKNEPCCDCAVTSPSDYLFMSITLSSNPKLSLSYELDSGLFSSEMQNCLSAVSLWKRKSDELARNLQIALQQFRGLSSSLSSDSFKSGISLLDFYLNIPFSLTDWCIMCAMFSLLVDLTSV